MGKIKDIYNNYVVRNMVYLGVGNGLSQLFNMVAVILITGFFCPTEYGKYAFMMSQALLLSVVADMGMRNIIIRDIARNLNEKISVFSTAFIIILLSNLLLFGIYFCYNHFLGELDLFQLLLISLYSVILCLNNLCESIFMGSQKMAPISFWNILTSSVWLLFIWVMPKEHISVNFLFVASLVLFATKFICCFIQLIAIRKYSLIGKVQRSKIIDLIVRSAPYLGLALVALPANYLSNNFLQLNSTEEQIGFFSLGQKLTNPLTVVFAIIFSATFPNMSVLWSNDKPKFFKTSEKGIAYFILFASFCSFLFCLLIEPVFKLFFDVQYLQAINVCKLMVWHVCLMGICSLIGTIWGAMNKEKLAFHTAIINAAINIPLLWLGSKYGAESISVAYIVSFSIFIVILWLVFLKTNKPRKEITYAWLPAILLFILSLYY
ncbi:oligosaccharide flippase family protein [Bacteroidales bacterium OttesenSCG-928-A17]|nr:oligosaccharide flippase family protein [Bacteroidales bacterium OttesenSCG-928-A17]